MPPLEPDTRRNTRTPGTARSSGAAVEAPGVLEGVCPPRGAISGRALTRCPCEQRPSPHSCSFGLTVTACGCGSHPSGAAFPLSGVGGRSRFKREATGARVLALLPGWAISEIGTPGRYHMRIYGVSGTHGTRDFA